MKLSVVDAEKSRLEADNPRRQVATTTDLARVWHSSEQGAQRNVDVFVSDAVAQPRSRSDGRIGSTTPQSRP
jgi:hypothetical protein